MIDQPDDNGEVPAQDATRSTSGVGDAKRALDQADQNAEVPAADAAASTGGINEDKRAIEIVAYLQTAGTVVPDTLRDSVYGVGDSDPPSMIIESAEGITTFGGFNGHPGTANAKQWLQEQRKLISEKYGPQAKK
jgi:hypothetical protein